MSQLLNYLNTLDKDAAARDAHTADPKAAMDAYGLASHEQEAMLSGDKNKIAGVLGISADALPALSVPLETY